MNRHFGYRTGFDHDDYTGRGTPSGGHFGPGRSLYTDERYGDRDIFFDDEWRDDSDRVWDLQELGVKHPEGLDLIGDEISYGIHYGKGPKGYRRSDQTIYEDVCESLTMANQVDATDIEVAVDKGQVLLKGMVRGRQMKRMAERCIENIPGVEDVQNQLSIL